MNAMIAMLNISIGAQAAPQAIVPPQGALLGGKASSSDEFSAVLSETMAVGTQGTVSGTTLNLVGAGVKKSLQDYHSDAVDHIQASLAGGTIVPAQAQAAVTSVDAQPQATAAITPDGASDTQGQTIVQIPVTGQAQPQAQAVTTPAVAQAQSAVVTTPVVAQAPTAAFTGATPVPVENPVVEGLANMQSIKDSGAADPGVNAGTLPASNILNPLKADSPAVSADVMARLNAFGGGKANPFIKDMGGRHLSGKGLADPKAEALVSSGKAEGGVLAQAQAAAAAVKPATGEGFKDGSGSGQGFSGQQEATLTAAISNSADDEAQSQQSGFEKLMISEVGPGTQSMSEAVVKAQVASSLPANLSKVIQVNDQSFSVVRRGDNSLELTLQPEGMGKLHLEVSVNKGIVTAHINAPDQASKDVIERNLQGILNELQKEGLDVGGFSVDVRSGNGEQVADQKKNNEGSAKNPDEEEAGTLVSAGQADKSTMSADRLVSVYA